MKTLALDCSTPQASMALFEDDRLVAETGWFEERSRHERLFDAGAELMHEAGWRWEELELFAVGRGPGAYSGLRVSLLAAQAWAAPGRRPVVAVSSMEASARVWLEATGSPSLWVVGDARRATWWYGEVIRGQTGTPVPWRVAPCTEIERIIPANVPVATPHPVVVTTWPTAHVMIPDAPAIARLARTRLHSSVPPEPLLPLYLHAAV
ncbi:MAG TPA: tRNA (adenosine(37)-N6)-threonylcarbamoyltransferase complex dimerization subunit type 1 TsaB [Kiritimatiellia bacterium]|nr:tRNA (adenosine(37)-N6)-threonylcarbamoyltransferase complex dimerization subunit type 1 TsaB [Kiritimatiellia bacterium]HMP34502.1 tRNA (adenosine(37)-N6)-threonylcarbamoyltransferase complex dimerization subunit type 1 TsaB [Kiritimatiellia bacterium]